MGESIDDIASKCKKKEGAPMEVTLASFKENSTLVDVFDRIVNALQVLASNEKGTLKQNIEEVYQKIYNGKW